MPDKALVIRDDKGKFKDVGDVLAIARAEGKKLFKTHENVFIIRMFYDNEVGWIAVVRYPLSDAGCSTSAGVSEGEKRMKNEDRRRVRLESQVDHSQVGQRQRPDC